MSKRFLSKRERQNQRWLHRFGVATRNPKSNLTVQYCAPGGGAKSSNPSDDYWKRRATAAEKKLQIQVDGKKSFYESRAWQNLRYLVLRASQGRCELCGSCKADGAVLQVDHIKPRSTHPQLELERGNLQVLCRSCNLGKSNKDTIDWREPRLRIVRGG